MTQTSIAKFIYHLTMIRSKKMIKNEYGIIFWKVFKYNSDEKFLALIEEYPNIGDSMFAFNYAYAPSYVAWFTAMEKAGLNQHACDVLMLKMNEKMLLTVPKAFLHAVGKAYYRDMRKKAEKRMENTPVQLHPFDWDIEYRRIDNDSFEIDIQKCGFIAYAKKYGCENMLPGICQVDYMISHFMNVGFSRTQTLGAGGTMCDCCYHICGSCDWNIEKRLEEKR